MCFQTLGIQPSGSQPRKLLQSKPAHPWGPFNLPSSDGICSSVLLFRSSVGPPGSWGAQKTPNFSWPTEDFLWLEWKKQIKHFSMSPDLDWCLGLSAEPLETIQNPTACPWDGITWCGVAGRGDKTQSSQELFLEVRGTRHCSCPRPKTPDFSSAGFLQIEQLSLKTLVKSFYQPDTMIFCDPFSGASTPSEGGKIPWSSAHRSHFQHKSPDTVQ